MEKTAVIYVFCAGEYVWVIPCLKAAYRVPNHSKAKVEFTKDGAQMELMMPEGQTLYTWRSFLNEKAGADKRGQHTPSNITYFCSNFLKCDRGNVTLRRRDLRDWISLQCVTKAFHFLRSWTARWTDLSLWGCRAVCLSVWTLTSGPPAPRELCYLPFYSPSTCQTSNTTHNHVICRNSPMSVSLWVCGRWLRGGGLLCEAALGKTTCR